MTSLKREGGLEIGQDIKYQALTWRIQRGIWVLGLIVLLAAVLGLLGPGPLSRTVAGQEENSISIGYNRFERYQAPVQLKLQVGPENVIDGRVRIWFNREFVENVQLEHIDPEPEKVEVGPDRFLYVFRVLSANEPVEIIVHLKPNKFGTVRGRLGLDEKEGIAFKQFYFP